MPPSRVPHTFSNLPASSRRFGTARIVAMVVGAFFALTGVALIFGVGLLGWTNATQLDATRYFSTSPQRYFSSTFIAVGIFALTIGAALIIVGLRRSASESSPTQFMDQRQSPERTSSDQPPDQPLEAIQIGDHGSVNHGSVNPVGRIDALMVDALMADPGESRTSVPLGGEQLTNPTLLRSSRPPMISPLFERPSKSELLVDRPSNGQLQAEVAELGMKDQ